MLWVIITGIVYSSRTPVTTNENQTQAQSINNTKPEDPGHTPQSLPLIRNNPDNKIQGLDLTKTLPVTYRPKYVDTFSDTSLHEPLRAVVKKPAPFSLPQHLTTEKPAFHFITKAPLSDSIIKTTELVNASVARRPIVPTTYSPPKFFLKSILSKSNSSLPDSEVFSFNAKIERPKALKSVRKFINPITVNHELSTTGSSFESAEKLISGLSDDNSETELTFKPSVEPSTVRYLVTPSTTTSTSTTTTPRVTTTEKQYKKSQITDKYISEKLSLEKEKLRHYIEPDHSNTAPNQKRFRTTVEIPPAHAFVDSEDKQKPEPDQPPSYKIKPFPKPIVQSVTKTDIPQNTSTPARVSRVNAAIKSLIAIGGARRQTPKCIEPKCNEKQRYLFLI